MQSPLFMVAPTVTVGDLVRHLKHVLEVDPIAQDVWVRGEISNFLRSGALSLQRPFSAIL